MHCPECNSYLQIEVERFYENVWDETYQTWDKKEFYRVAVAYCPCCDDFIDAEILPTFTVAELPNSIGISPDLMCRYFSEG